MELYQLKTFVTVADEGLLSNGAKRLNTSQPALSAHIKALESELGISLFHRTPKGMLLTPAGEKLLKKATAILEATEDLKYTALSLGEVLSGDVRIGLHTDPKILRITDILSEFRLKYPHLSLTYLQRMSWQAPKDIMSRNLDAAFVYLKPNDERICIEIIEDIELAIVAPVLWQERLEHSTLQNIAGYPWVWADVQCPLFKVVVDLFATIGQEPAKAVIVEEESAIIKLVSEEVGLSLVPLKKAKEAAHADQVYIVNIPIPNLELLLISLKSRANDPIVKAILDIVHTVWR